jgi:hypothetical protein
VTTTTIEQASVRGDLATAQADLQAAHLEAAGIVAELDLDDTAVWRAADGFVADIAAAAYDVAPKLTGDPPVQVAARVPPVVRVRELATAQRRLFSVLNRRAAIGEPLDQAADQVRMLGRGLRCVTRSAQH